MASAGDRPPPPASPSFQSALAAVDAASAAVAAAAVLPSRGETADDVAAGDLKYLVLPAWRGDLLSAAAPPSRPDPAARARALRRAAAEWRAFLGDAAACGAVPRSAAAGAGGDDDDDDDGGGSDDEDYA